MQADCPRHVVFQGRGLNHAGAGRAPGSVAFVDAGRGDVVELFFAEVVQVGGIFGLCRVANNPALPPIRVDQGLLNGAGPLRLGQILLIGPLAFEQNGPRAQAAWPVDVQPTHKPAPARVRKLGIITAVKPGFGFIRPADGSPDVFCHFSECQGFTPVAGMSVQFTPAADPRGPQARNVLPM